MLKQYFGLMKRLVGQQQENGNHNASSGNVPRTGNFGSWKISSGRSKRDEIFGTGGQWGAVESNIVSDQEHGQPSESQEDIMGRNKGIQRTVDVEMWHSDRKSDSSIS
jgi:hypothetical protein